MLRYEETSKKMKKSRYLMSVFWPFCFKAFTQRIQKEFADVTFNSIT